MASIRAAFDRAADDLVEEWQNGPMEITERDRRMGGLTARRDAAIRRAKSAFYAAQGHHIPPSAFARHPRGFGPSPAHRRNTP